MPRSSSHKSHRSHKHRPKEEKDRSDSEDDRNEKKPSGEDGPRASKDAEPEKRKPSSQQEKDPVAASNGGDSSGEHRKKRKDRVEDSVAGDRWSGGQKEDTADKKPKHEASEPADADKAVKSKPLDSDSKGRSRGKHDASNERNEEGDNRDESAKRRPEKDPSRRESGVQSSKDAKERDKEHYKDSREKERDCSKDEREKDRGKNAKERDKENSKLSKERDKEHCKDSERERDNCKDAKERDKDNKHVKERDKDYKDAKERDRDYKDAKERDRDPKDAKERERDYKDSKEKGRDYSKDAKESGREYSKDAKERDKDYYKKDAKEERDYKDAKERDKDYYKKDAKEGRDYKDAKDRDRERGKDYSKDAKERDRDTDGKERDIDYSKDGKERDMDYSKDVKERDRDHSKDVKERDKGYKDAKERERDYSKDTKEDRKCSTERDREQGSEWDKRVQDSRHERSDDVARRKERQIQDDKQNLEQEKDRDKRTRRRERSVDKEKLSGGGKDSDDKQLSSGDDQTKNDNRRDERHQEGRYRDKYRDDSDRDQRHRDDRGRDEHHSRDYNSKKSDNKHFRDEVTPSGSRYKKNKTEDSDHDSSRYVDDHGTKLKYNRARKRYYDEYDDKHQFFKEPHENVEKISSSTRSDSRTDRGRIDHPRSDKVDSSLGSNKQKSSQSPNKHAAKDQNRKSLAEDGFISSRGDNATVSGKEKDSESRVLEKSKPKEDGIRSNELPGLNSHNTRIPKSVSHTSPSLPSKRSPNTADWRISDRIGTRRSLDVEGQRSSYFKNGRDNTNAKDRERVFPLEKSLSDDLSQPKLINSEPLNRGNHSLLSSPSRLPAPSPMRHGAGSPLLSSYEDDNRGQYSARRPNRRYNLSSEHGMGRGQGNARRNAPTWPSPAGNSFIPLQHGPMTPGFHPSIQQFPAPLLYHMHESAERFPPHVRPFGWPNPVGDSPHHLLQVWDGSNSAFGGESRVYGRPEWDIGRHVIGNRMWEGQNENSNMELSVPHVSDYSANALSDKASAGNSGIRLERFPSDNSETRLSNDKLTEKDAMETPRRSLHEQTPAPSKTPRISETSKTSCYDNISICRNYLSKLDISVDICHQELYQQCMTLLGTSDVSVSKPEKSQNNKEDARIVGKGTKHILNSIFSTKTEAVFQRAMSLYKKQREERKQVFPASSSGVSESKDSSEVSKQEEMEGVDHHISPSDTSLVVETEGVDHQNCPPDTSPVVETLAVAVSKEVSLANANLSSDIIGVAEMVTDVEVEEVSSDPAAEEKEQQTDTTSYAAHFGEGSQSSEALMAECRVNLNRIHLSPGSTH